MAIAIFFLIFGAHMYILFIIKVKFLNSLNGHIDPPNYIDYELEWLASFEHVVQSHLNMSFWCLFLDPHLTTHHSNIGITIFSNWRLFMIWDYLRTWFQIKNKENTNIYSLWLSKPIRMGGTNQFGINTCHHNNKLDQILNHLHLVWDFPKSPINEYSLQLTIFFTL